MTIAAHVKITSGPDEGKVYAINEEIVHIGQDPDSQIPLTDPSVDEHQASIVQRNGRYAIYTPLDNVLEVDGNGIPAEKWVWLPEDANIRIGDETTLHFQVDSNSAGVASPQDAGDVPKPPAMRPKPGVGKRKRKKQPATAQRRVAQFITDQAGDHLVRLGEDGQLPELSLAESGRKANVEHGQKEKNPAVLYIALGVSLLASLAMLVFESGPGGASSAERREARQAVEKFFGTDKGELKPYQRYLREARRASSIGDRQTEFESYQKVLDLLNSEDVINSHNGLTGDKKDDEELRRQIGILLDR